MRSGGYVGRPRPALTSWSSLEGYPGPTNPANDYDRIGALQ